MPLLVLFVVLMWAMVAQGRKLARAPDPYDVAVGRALVIVVVSLIAMDVVWPYVSNGGMPQVLWCLFALVSPLGARVGAVGRGAPVDVGARGGDSGAALPADSRSSDAAGRATR